MASLKEIAREYRDEIMDGIAWVAIWKTGRSWNAKAFWLNLETERIEDEEMEEAREIVAADPKAIFINEYYTAHMGEGKLDEIVEGIRFMYENEYNLLANNTAYAEEEQEGIRFEASEKMEEITTITKDYGWLEPNGTFHAVEWGDHQEWANDYLDKNLTQEERFAAMVEINASGMVKNSPDVIGAADYLVRRGWVLLHNPQQGIAIPTRDITREYTKAQKEFLYDYYMERDCKEEANAIWQDE